MNSTRHRIRLSMLIAALELAANGWSVFPCVPTGPKAKSPLTIHGHLDASQNAEIILGWWRRWPDAMIATPVPDKLLILDIDPRNGGSLQALEACCGALPTTLTAWSGRGDGGRHLYFRRPSGAFTSTKLPAGIDLKAKGYVILPPSIHPVSGEPYRWEHHDIATMSAGLRELLRPAPAKRFLPRTGHGNGAPLIRVVTGLREGERNEGLFWAACRACESGILTSVEADLIAAAASVGLSEHEARQTISSAIRTIGVGS